LVAVNTIKKQTDRAERLVEESLREFAAQVTWKATFSSHAEEIAQLIDPNNRNTFFYQNYNWPGQKKTQMVVDATGMAALNKFGAILDSLLTPANMMWHGLATTSRYLNKQRQVQDYFHIVRHQLFKYRYSANANFSGNNQGVYRNIGAYGTGAMFIDAFDGELSNDKGLRYRCMPFGEIFLRQNHQGMVDGFTRWFKLTAQEAWSNKQWRDNFPEQLIPPKDQKSGMTFDFIHRVVPRYDWIPGALGPKGKQWQSLYISMTGRWLMSEGGYTTLPAAISRYNQIPTEVYGRSVAMDVLPALKTLNAEKATFLKQGHRAVDPIYFTADDGIVDSAQMRPGVLNKGGVNAEGKLLIQGLPTGRIDTAKEMMDEERALINDAFLNTLFQILTETPQMTATEVIQRTAEKGILLAPTVGRQQNEYIGPLVEREIVVLAEQGLLPPMPGILREAKGEYHVVHTSPMSKAMKAGQAAGFFRTIEVVKELVNITGDKSLLFPFNFNNAVPEIAEINDVPIPWMATAQEIAQKTKQLAMEQERQAQIQEAPAAAAMMKAKAAVAKAQPQGQGQPVGPAQAPASPGAPLASQLTGG
jgi:hypothetical protein